MTSAHFVPGFTLTSVRPQNDLEVPRKPTDVTNISISTKNWISKSVCSKQTNRNLPLCTRKTPNLANLNPSPPSSVYFFFFWFRRPSCSLMDTFFPLFFFGFQFTSRHFRVTCSFVLTLFIFKAPNYMLARTLTDRVV